VDAGGHFSAAMGRKKVGPSIRGGPSHGETSFPAIP
jgi:hypothetical protein